MTVFIGGIGAVKKAFTKKSELIAELKRLYTLAWIADKKIQFETSSGRALNPQQKASSSRTIRKITKLADAHKNLINMNELLDIANETYNKVNS